MVTVPSPVMLATFPAKRADEGSGTAATTHKLANRQQFGERVSAGRTQLSAVCSGGPVPPRVVPKRRFGTDHGVSPAVQHSEGPRRGPIHRRGLDKPPWPGRLPIGEIRLWTIGRQNRERSLQVGGGDLRPPR
jgi:hypothetical protein